MEHKVLLNDKVREKTNSELTFFQSIIKPNGCKLISHNIFFFVYYTVK